jgi:TolB-like protein
METPLAEALRDRYTLQRQLGRGGMATVYLAHDLKHDRPVALKVLHPDLAHALGSERFHREIRFAARLQHPNILSVHDSGDAQGFFWFTMPYVEGESLRDRLSREGQLPIADAVRMVREVGEALGYAHRQGIIHRDVKPENVMLSHGHALVADFGIARSTDRRAGETGEATLTETGMTVGTVTYMSPEQASGGRDLDGRSDIYSLGCVLHELLAGQPPFGGATTMAVITQHFMTPAPPLRSLREDVPRHIEAAVLRALAKQPEGRFATIEEFAAALETPSATVRVPAAPAPAAPAMALAVLDFVNLGENQELSWLAGGMAEAIQLDLQRTGGLAVAGRDRVGRAVRDHGGAARTPEDAAVVGRAVGARWAVLGTYQPSGPQLVITTQCVAAADARVLAVRRFEGGLQEIFALQDRVATAVLETLSGELSTVQVARAEEPARPERRILAAYEAYAKGRQTFRQFGPAAFDEAERWYRLALETEPTYALAYSGLGALYAFRYIVKTRREDLDAAVTHLETALALDADLAEARTWLCYAYTRLHRYRDAEVAGLRATELAPDTFYPHYMLAVARHLGALDERRPGDLATAVEPYLRGVQIEPTAEPGYMGLGWLYVVVGQYAPARTLIDCALRIERGGLTRDFKFVGARTLRAAIHLREHEHDDARRLLAEAAETYPGIDHVYAASFTVMSHCLLGELALRTAVYDEALSAFERARDLAAASPQRIGMGYLAARAQFGLARAFRWLAMKKEAASAAALASGILERKGDYAFEWMWGVSDGEACADTAAWLAAAGRLDEAIAQLELGMKTGWRDVALLGSGSEFERYGEEPALRALRARLEAVPEIPVPPTISSLAH